MSKTQTNSKVHSQFNVVEEVFGCFRKAQEEAVSVFALALVELGDHPHIQKLVEDSATVLPFATVSHSGNVPRVYIHA